MDFVLEGANAGRISWARERGDCLAGNSSLFSHSSTQRTEGASGREAMGSSSSLLSPSALLGIPGAAVSLELCSSGDTLMRCTMHPVPIQPDADRSSVCECVLSWPPMENNCQCCPLWTEHSIIMPRTCKAITAQSAVMVWRCSRHCGGRADRFGGVGCGPTHGRRPRFLGCTYTPTIELFCLYAGRRPMHHPIETLV